MGAIKLSNKRFYPFFIENPISGDNIPRIRVPHDFVVLQIVAVKGDAAAGSFDWEMEHSDSSTDQGAGTVIHSDTGVSENTTGIIYDVVTDFAAITVPQFDYIWVNLTNVSTGLARPVWLSVTVYGGERGS